MLPVYNDGSRCIAIWKLGCISLRVEVRLQIKLNKVLVCVCVCVCVCVYIYIYIYIYINDIPKMLSEVPEILSIR
jgi:hypothetical protein